MTGQFLDPSGKSTTLNLLNRNSIKQPPHFLYLYPEDRASLQNVQGIFFFSVAGDEQRDPQLIGMRNQKA